MTRRNKRTDGELLKDILESSWKLVRITDGMTEDAFQEDEVVQLAAIRLIEIIGEAAGRLSEEFRISHPDLPWRRMADARNFLIHEYASVDTIQVWRMAKQSVPPMIPSLERILDRTGGEEGPSR